MIRSHPAWSKMLIYFCATDLIIMIIMRSFISFLPRASSCIFPFLYRKALIRMCGLVRGNSALLHSVLVGPVWEGGARGDQSFWHHYKYETQNPESRTGLWSESINKKFHHSHFDSIGIRHSWQRAVLESWSFWMQMVVSWILFHDFYLFIITNYSYINCWKLCKLWN